MENQGAQVQQVNSPDKINTPNDNYGILFRNTTDGNIYVKLPNGSVEQVSVGSQGVGSSTLIGGTKDVADAKSVSTSKVLVSPTNVHGGTSAPIYVDVSVPGTITFTALKADGTLDMGDVSSFDYFIIY